MKRSGVLMLAASLVGLSGCAGDSRRDSGKDRLDVSKREEYRKQTQAELDKFDGQIDAWREKAREAKGDAKVNMEKALDELKAKRADAARRLDQLKDKNKDNWDQLKHEADRAVGDFKRAFNKTRLRFGTRTEAAGDQASQKREEVRKKLQTRLNEMDETLAKWKDEAREAKGDAKVKKDKALARLQKKRDEAARHLKDLKENSKGALDDLSKRAGKALDELKKGFEEAKDSFK